MKCFRVTTRIALALAATLAAAPAVVAGSLAVGKKAEINVDPKKMDAEKAALWKKFGGWCAIKDWHPAIANCEESKEGADTYRTLTLKDGGKIKEKQIEYRDDFYKYVIVESPLPVKDYQAQFALTPDDDDEDEINFAWSAVFDPADGKEPKEARDVINGIFTDGLDNIKKMTGGDKN
ncbi:MAG: SRPBCC family protein [Hyphomicrobium sp.]